jgi:hypothetical protein
MPALPQNLTFTNQIEDTLDIMGEAAYPVEAEHTTVAFNGMQRPEYPVNEITVLRSSLQLQKGTFEIC